MKIEPQGPFQTRPDDARLGSADIFRSIHFSSLRELYAESPLRAEALLQVYYPVYEKNFPDPDERIPLETLISIVRDPAGTSDVRIAHLGDRIIGGSHFRMMEVDGLTLGYEAFIWIEPEMRGRPEKFGKRLYDSVVETMKARGACGIIGELNDPHMMSDEVKAQDCLSGITPEKRVAFWEKLGRKAADCPFPQPAFGPGMQPVQHIMLTVEFFDASRQSLSSEMVKAIYLEMYRPAVLGRDVKGDLIYREFSEYLSGRSEVPLIPLTVPRSFLTETR